VHLTPRAVLFDLYNTLVSIRTDEHQPRVWESLALFLRYRGLPARAGALRRGYLAGVRRAQRASAEAHPEIDVAAIFGALVGEMGHDEDDGLDAEAARLFRVLSIVRIGLFPDTLATLEALRGRFRLGLVSDAQRVWLEPEMRMLGLEGAFDTMVVSVDHGYRKPDPRLFHLALERLGVAPSEAVYVGDMAALDVCGARAAGLRAVWVRRSHAPQPAPGCPPDLTVRSLSQLSRALLG
jgi:putative hydrolase of the HAD superfamily